MQLDEEQDAERRNERGRDAEEPHARRRDGGHARSRQSITSSAAAATQNIAASARRSGGFRSGGRKRRRAQQPTRSRIAAARQQRQEAEDRSPTGSRTRVGATSSLRAQRRFDMALEREEALGTPRPSALVARRTWQRKKQQAVRRDVCSSTRRPETLDEQIVRSPQTSPWSPTTDARSRQQQEAARPSSRRTSACSPTGCRTCQLGVQVGGRAAARWGRWLRAQESGSRAGRPPLRGVAPHEAHVNERARCERLEAPPERP